MCRLEICWAPSSRLNLAHQTLILFNAFEEIKLSVSLISSVVPILCTQSHQGNTHSTLDFLLPAEKAEGRLQPRPAHALWVLGPLLTMSAPTLLPALEMRERGSEHLPGQDLCE